MPFFYKFKAKKIKLMSSYLYTFVYNIDSRSYTSSLYIIPIYIGLLQSCTDNLSQKSMKKDESYAEISRDLNESQITNHENIESFNEALHFQDTNGNRELLNKILVEFENELHINQNTYISVLGYILGSLGEVRNYTTGLKFGKTACTILNLDEDYKNIIGIPVGVTSLLTHAALSAETTAYYLNEMYNKKWCSEKSTKCSHFINGAILCCTLLGGLNFIYPNYIAYDGNIPAMLALGIPSIISTSSYLYKYSKSTVLNVKNLLSPKSEQQIEEERNKLQTYNKLLQLIATTMRYVESNKEGSMSESIASIDSNELTIDILSNKKKIVIAFLSAIGSLFSTTILFLLSEESMLQFLSWISDEQELNAEDHCIAYAHAAITSIPWFLTNSQAFYNKTICIIDRMKSDSVKNYYDPNSLITIPISYLITAIAAMPWLYLSWIVLEDYGLLMQTIISGTSFAASIFLRGESFRDLLWKTTGGVSRIFRKNSSFFKKLDDKYNLRNSFKKISTALARESYNKLLSLKEKFYDSNTYASN